MADQPSPPTRKSRAAWAVAGAFIAGALAFVTAMRADGIAGIEVSAGGFLQNALLVSNIGSGPIQILDITINDRDECSRLSSLGAFQFPTDIAHKAWVSTGRDLISAGEMDDFRRLQGFEPRTLQVGESKQWIISCRGGIVRASVTTDAGSAAYTFKK